MSVGAEAQLPSAWIVALTAIASNGNTGYFAGVCVKDKDILFIICVIGNEVVGFANEGYITAVFAKMGVGIVVGRLQTATSCQQPLELRSCSLV